MAYDYISPTRWDEGLTRSPSTTIFLVHIHYVQIMFTRDRYQLSQSAQWTEYWTGRLRNYSTLNTSDGRAEYNSLVPGYSAILPR